MIRQDASLDVSVLTKGGELEYTNSCDALLQAVEDLLELHSKLHPVQHETFKPPLLSALNATLAALYFSNGWTEVDVLKLINEDRREVSEKPLYLPGWDVPSSLRP
jgi:hypothetical protein